MIGLIATSLVPIQSSAKEPGSPKMQTPEADSVGTSTNLELASNTLLIRFDQLSRRGNRLSLEDLRDEISTQTTNGQDKAQDAARFFIVIPIARILAGETKTGSLTRAGLASAAQLAMDPRLDEQLL